MLKDHVEDPSKELMRVVTKHNLTDRSLRDISLLLNSHHNDHENIPTTKKTYLKNLGMRAMYVLALDCSLLAKN